MYMYIHMHIHIHTYIYIYVWVCMCMCIYMYSKSKDTLEGWQHYYNHRWQCDWRWTPNCSWGSHWGIWWTGRTTPWSKGRNRCDGQQREMQRQVRQPSANIQEGIRSFAWVITAPPSSRRLIGDRGEQRIGNGSFPSRQNDASVSEVGGSRDLLSAQTYTQKQNGEIIIESSIVDC